MRILALVAVAALALAGCVTPTDTVSPASLGGAPSAGAPARVVYHTGLGEALNVTDAAGNPLPGVALPLPLPNVAFFDTGYDGGEPTLGITKSGTLFYQAFENTLRSRDFGRTWERVNGPLMAPTTLDPFLWVDQDTGRVFSNQLYLACSWLSWSDDEGDTWLANPVACGIPVNDHQKITTGKPTTLATTPAYPNVVYYAYNALAGSRVAISLDGGATFPLTSQSVMPQTTCNGGLHGSIHADANGNLYLPKRDCGGAVVATSKDDGLTWTAVKVGEDVGGSACRKNPEVTTDLAGNAYLAWPAKNNGLYYATSTDGGAQWSPSLRASPADVTMTTMPVLQAGDAGRVAFAYYGARAVADGPDLVPEDTRWHLFVTYTLDALDATPTFVTMQVTPDEDPVQIGPISTNSECESPPGSRNLLDFIDLVMDGEGRVYVAYADGCTDGCAGKEDATMADSRDAQGFVAVLQTGPSLLADVGVLVAAPAKAAEAAGDARAAGVGLGL